MKDREIVDMYWSRDPRAIALTGEKYGGYIARVAQNVLGDREDAEECVNDTYLAAWNAMPPQRPAVLRTFLGKLSRRISLNRLRARLAAKRGGGEAVGAIEELAEVVPGPFDTEGDVEARELARVLDKFLDGISARDRAVFVRRYWYFDPISSIAGEMGMREGAVKVCLHRTRERLRAYLEKEEWL